MSASPIESPGGTTSVPVLPLSEAPLPDALPQDLLYVPRPSDGWVPPLEMIRRLAHEDLAVQQKANIHDREAMVRAATTLEIRLRQVLAALDAAAVSA